MSEYNRPRNNSQGPLGSHQGNATGSSSAPPPSVTVTNPFLMTRDDLVKLSTDLCARRPNPSTYKGSFLGGVTKGTDKDCPACQPLTTGNMSTLRQSHKLKECITLPLDHPDSAYMTFARMTAQKTYASLGRLISCPIYGMLLTDLPVVSDQERLNLDHGTLDASEATIRDWVPPAKAKKILVDRRANWSTFFNEDRIKLVNESLVRYDLHHAAVTERGTNAEAQQLSVWDKWQQIMAEGPFLGLEN
jgi:hypothetical protein